MSCDLRRFYPFHFPPLLALICPSVCIRYLRRRERGCGQQLCVSSPWCSILLHVPPFSQFLHPLSLLISTNPRSQFDLLCFFREQAATPSSSVTPKRVDFSSHVVPHLHVKLLRRCSPLFSHDTIVRSKRREVMILISSQQKLLQPTIKLVPSTSGHVPPTRHSSSVSRQKTSSRRYVLPTLSGVVVNTDETSVSILHRCTSISNAAHPILLCLSEKKCSSLPVPPFRCCTSTATPLYVSS